MFETVIFSYTKQYKLVLA